MLILKTLLINKNMFWLFIFHSLQVYGNRWTKWFWIWVDISTKERNGGVSSTYLASRVNARLSKICLPVRYCRVRSVTSHFVAFIQKGCICHMVLQLGLTVVQSNLERFFFFVCVCKHLTKTIRSLPSAPLVGYKNPAAVWIISDRWYWETEGTEQLVIMG